MTIIAGDIGGTKAIILALDEEPDATWTPIVRQVLRTSEYAGLPAMLKAFLQRAGKQFDVSRIRRACFGVAGPIVDGRCTAPNIPWAIDERDLYRVHGFSRVVLLNDLEATAYGVLELPADCTTPLGPLSIGSEFRGARAVIAAGTGLGMAILTHDGSSWRALASEGGHANFGPRTELEMQTVEVLRRRYGRVSNERILSGPGICDLYGFFSAQDGEEADSEIASEIERDATLAPEVITRAAIARTCPVCVVAMRTFVSVYGAVAGDLALMAKAIGGVYIAGGIVAKILPLLQQSEFLSAFTDKGRMSYLVRDIPITLVRSVDVAAIGAGAFIRAL